MALMVLTEQHLRFLSLKGGCTGSTKMRHWWNSQVMAHIYFYGSVIIIVLMCCEPIGVSHYICMLILYRGYL